MSRCAFRRLLWGSKYSLNPVRRLNEPQGPYRVDGTLKSAKTLRATLEQHVTALNAQAPLVSVADAKALQPRSMSDSHDRVVIPLESDPDLRLQYINWMNYVRFGMILEDLDTFAVWLSYKHNQGNSDMGRPAHHPMAIVTACVDRIDLHHVKILPDRDIIMDGHITWVGRSSTEATMWLLQQQDDSKWCQLLKAKFVMVSRNPHGPGVVANHPLQLNTEQESSIFREGQEASARRRQKDQESLLKRPPTETERVVLHEVFRKTVDENAHTFRHRILPDNHVWMEDSKLKTVIICFPAQRNLYNKIFGGFLMRQAFELAWANCALYSKSRPRLLAVDDIMFRKSVDVGSLLFLSSQVCFTNNGHMQLRVHAEVVDPETGSQETTNTFHFTFATRDKAVTVPTVVPMTYADGMLFLSGRRHYEECIGDNQCVTET